MKKPLHTLMWTGVAASVAGVVAAALAGWRFSGLPSWLLGGGFLVAHSVMFVGVLGDLAARLVRGPAHPAGSPVAPYGRLLVCILFVILGFGILFTELGLETREGDIISDGFSCLYFSAVTFTTLGYGDLRPSLAARPFAAIEALVGYVYLGVLVGAMLLLPRRGGAASASSPPRSPWTPGEDNEGPAAGHRSGEPGAHG